MASLNHIKYINGAVGTTDAPTGTDLAKALAIPHNVDDIGLDFRIRSGTTPDVDVKLFVLGHDGDWYELESVALQNLQDETGDRYIFALSHPQLYKAIQPQMILNSGSVVMDCFVVIRTK